MRLFPTPPFFATTEITMHLMYRVATMRIVCSVVRVFDELYGLERPHIGDKTALVCVSVRGSRQAHPARKGEIAEKTTYRYFSDNNRRKEDDFR